MESFGDRVRRLRKAKRYTQEELGVAAGLGGGTVSRWERGAEENPTRTAIGAVARVLGVSADYLITGADGSAGATLEVDTAQEKVEAAMAYLSVAFREWQRAVAIATGNAEPVVEPGVAGGPLRPPPVRTLPERLAADADAIQADAKIRRRRPPAPE